MKIEIDYDEHPDAPGSKQVIHEMEPCSNTAFGWRTKRVMDPQELVGKTIRALEISGQNLLLEVE